MNVIGVGIDLVDLERVARLFANKGEHAMQRFFTDEERAYLATRPDPTGHAAARIAAKEAVYKALQSLPGARAIGWRDIEVLRATATAGRPFGSTAWRNSSPPSTVGWWCRSRSPIPRPRRGPWRWLERPGDR